MKKMIALSICLMTFLFCKAQVSWTHRQEDERAIGSNGSKIWGINVIGNARPIIFNTGSKTGVQGIRINFQPSADSISRIKTGATLISKSDTAQHQYIPKKS